MALMTVEMALMNCLLSAWPRHAGRQSSAVVGGSTSVCPTCGAVTAKLTVRTVLMRRGVLQRNARMVSSAVPVASASRHLLCATTRPTAMMAAMRPPAQPPPAAPSPSVATTQRACPACGSVMVMPTAQTAQMRPLRHVAHSPSFHPPGLAPPKSSTAAVASASTRAGGVMVGTTAWIAQTKATAPGPFVALTSSSVVMEAAFMVVASVIMCMTART